MKKTNGKRNDGCAATCAGIVTKLPAGARKVIALEGDSEAGEALLIRDEQLDAETRLPCGGTLSSVFEVYAAGRRFYGARSVCGPTGAADETRFEPMPAAAVRAFVLRVLPARLRGLLAAPT
jgi:hypothetical protein